MPVKDPTTWSLVTWSLVLGMSFIGGITSWYGRVKAGHARAFNLIELIGELATSGLMGFAGFNVAIYFFSDSIGLASVIGGMSAHFSTRLLFQAEGLLTILGDKLEGKVKEL